MSVHLLRLACSEWARAPGVRLKAPSKDSDSKGLGRTGLHVKVTLYLNAFVVFSNLKGKPTAKG